MLRFLTVLLILWINVGLVHANTRDVNLVKESQQFARSNKVAVVVGVNNYAARSGLRSLKYAVPDAQLMKRALEKHGYTVQMLTDHQASADFVLNAIEQAGRVLDSNQGTLVFFFSGHGFADPTSGVNYLASYGTTANPSRVSGSALSLQAVEAEIRKTGVKRAVMLIDACRDNPFMGKSIAQPSFMQRESEGIKALYSTKFGELSYETPQLGHGVFSHFLYRGLSGHAVEQDGVISFDSLKRYVQNETAKWTYQHLSKAQKPYSRERSDSFGVFVLGQIGAPPRQPTPPPQAVVQPAVATRPAPQPASSAIVTRPPPQSAPVRPAAASRAIEPEMVAIPAGTFIMGCLEGRDDVDATCFDEEKPAHEVTLSSFFIGKYEVTIREWDACVVDGACLQADNHGWGNVARPVTNVSWNAVQTYIDWLNKKTGKQYRLPTEAEWEYAARAGANTVYPWGNSIQCGNANTNYPCKGKTVGVGSYKANVFGVHDMIGNVWEWTQDWYDSYSVNPVRTLERRRLGFRRVARGGSWLSEDSFARITYRYAFSPDFVAPGSGFRLALDD